ncbi:MAG: CRISPR-associated helicase Cas3' [Methanomassiliicoccales archaeon]|jgi:CRISPR-associated endonuclease/helicase Cas3
MSSYSELRSHPNKLLEDHLKEVGETCKEILLSLVIKDNGILANFAYLMGVSHDFGKGTSFFQDHLNRGIKTEKAFHSKLSSVFGYYLCKKYIQATGSFAEHDLSVVVWLAIMKHHTDISDLLDNGGELEKLQYDRVEKIQIENIRRYTLEHIENIYKRLVNFEISFNEFFENYDNLCAEIEEKWESIIIDEKKGWEYYFLTMLFYSVLLDADKLSASDIGFVQIRREREKWEEISLDVLDRYRAMKLQADKSRKINIIRSRAYDEVISHLDYLNLSEKRILSIELPTGCGKTLIALGVALRIRERIKKEFGFSPRTIYCLPFLSIIDQNADVFTKVLALHTHEITSENIANHDSSYTDTSLSNSIPTSLLMKHHHLSEIRYVSGNGEFDVERSLLLIEGWHSEVIVTTFVQFFHTLITNRNRAARKFHNIVNSIIILDEVQSLPYRYWLLVNHALKYLAVKFNCWIILMTATMPLIFDPNEIVSLVSNRNYYFEQFNRVRYIFDRDEKTIDEVSNIVFEDIINTDKNIGVVLNTINSCKELYQNLRKQLTDLYGEPKISDEGIAEFNEILLINLSSHVLPKYRRKRIERIRNKEEKRRKIVITTQLIEAGVDIDLDKIYRDFAPLDGIIQSGGRCNRNDREIGGVVRILNLLDKDGRNFSKFVYDSTLLGISREIIKNEFEETDILGLVQMYFSKIHQRGTDSPSKETMESVYRFEFSEIGRFELLGGDKETRKTDVFVEIDEEARKIWSDFISIQKIEKGLERRSEFLKIRNKFYDYVISVDWELVRNAMVDEDLAHITADNYDLETGFKMKENNSFIV